MTPDEELTKPKPLDRREKLKRALQLLMIARDYLWEVAEDDITRTNHLSPNIPEAIISAQEAMDLIRK